VLLDAGVTSAPPSWVGWFNVTVPVEETPPTTLEGETLTLSTASAAL